MDNRTVLAHHEAAHTVIQYRVNGHADDSVTIIGRDYYLGAAIDHTSDSMCADHIEARILSCYAGGHAQRRCDPGTRDDGCGSDEQIAHDLLYEWKWEHREQEFRDRSAALVDQHWREIVAVALELLRTPTLDETEVELIADAAAGTAEFVFGDLAADLARYRWLKGAAAVPLAERRRDES